MVLDTSAVLAILLGEPEAELIARVIAGGPKRLLSVISLLESAIVIETCKGAAGGRELDLLLQRADIQIASMNADQAALARAAYSKYGKGRHPAGLNLGDCCAYALARYAAQSLLFKGTDFLQTDVASVQY